MMLIHHGPAMIVTDAMIVRLCERALVGVVCDDNVLLPLCEAMTTVEHEIAVRAMRNPTREQYHLRNATLVELWEEAIADREDREGWKGGPLTDRGEHYDFELRGEPAL